MSNIFIPALILFFVKSFAQPYSNERLNIDTEIIHHNQVVNFCYTPDSSIFSSNKGIHIKIFFTGLNDPEDEVKMFPKVFIPNLREETNLICSSIEIPEYAMGIVFLIYDSLQDIDSNNGYGYWRPIYSENKLIPGSLSSIASLLGYIRPQFNCSKKNIRSLFEKDFRLHPELKRTYSKDYIRVFDIQDQTDSELLRAELQQFTLQKDLNESELQIVRHQYSLLHEPDSAKLYDKFILEQYPDGPYAVQWNSLFPAMRIDSLSDFQEKWEAYHAYKTKYFSTYPNAFTRMLIQNRLGQLLKGMVVPMFYANDLKAWENEVETLDPRPKYNAYYRSSSFIVDQIQNAGDKLNNKPRIISLKIESQLFHVETTDEQLLIEYAEKLAREAVGWYKSFLDAPRTFQDSPVYIDAEIRSQREVLLAYALDALGKNLLFQNKIDEAREVLKEAIDFGKRIDADINERYIESLVRSGNIEEAIKEANIMISLGKSTCAINKFQENYDREHSSKDYAAANLKNRLKKEMLNEVMEEGLLLSMDGQEISISELRGKVIVLDFWATWCKPCLYGMQAAIDVVEKYKDNQDIVFLFVNTEKITEETKEKVNRKLQEMNYHFNVFFDPDINTSKALKVNVLPTLIIVDKKGKIRFRHKGIIMSKGKQELSDELAAMIELVR